MLCTREMCHKSKGSSLEDLTNPGVPHSVSIKNFAKTTTTTTTTVLRPFVRDYPGESVPEWQTILDFAEADMMGVAVASAEPYASYLHFALEDNHASTSSVRFFTGRMPFLTPNQQHQSTVTIVLYKSTLTIPYHTCVCIINLCVTWAYCTVSHCTKGWHSCACMVTTSLQWC